MALTRNVNPELGRLRGKLAVSVRQGNTEAADLARKELHAAKMLIAAKKVAAGLPDLTPEKREQIRALLGGA